MEDYGIKDIQHLDTRDAFRQRVSVYLGSDDNDGMYEAFKEIINNSTDEALAGYGKKISIHVDEDKNQITVKDNGRGVPFGEVDGRNILVAIFTESHTGGKFNKGAYKNSSGLNGLGGTAVCMTSDFFSVSSRRDGREATAVFRKGILESYREKDWQGPTGTTITFSPDKEVFINATENYSYNKICEQIKNISFLNKGIHFVCTNGKEEQNFYSQNGIADFIEDKIKTPLMKKPILVSVTDETDELEIAFIWTKDQTQSYVFVNGLMCSEGGSPITGAKQKITSKIKKLSGYNFDSELIRRGLVFAINCKVANPSFANQTKNKINNPNLRTLASKAFEIGLEKFSETSDFAPLIEMMTKIQAAERAADKARDAVLNQNKEIENGLKKRIILAEKLVDCRYHDERSQLMICEGKSAKGALVKARNGDTTACFDLRGKIINVLKNNEEKVSANEEVKQLHIALGCGLGNKFDIKKLRYGRIVIMADMDKDGYDIVCLLLSFFYKMYPQLLRAGKIYWGVTPLFKVQTKKQIYYAYNEAELATLPKGDLSRLKGLGEGTPQDFKNTIFSKEARMVQITMENAEAALEYFDLLLGENLEGRKEYIFENVDFENLED